MDLPHAAIPRPLPGHLPHVLLFGLDKKFESNAARQSCRTARLFGITYYAAEDGKIITTMDRPNSSLFEVYLRLRPSDADRDRFLDVDRTSTIPTHITIKPPADDKRKRAIEKFGFTRVFEEDAGQLDLFHETGAVSMIEGVLGARGREGRDGLLATLGVTGSGKVKLDTSLTKKLHADLKSRVTLSSVPSPSAV